MTSLSFIVYGTARPQGSKRHLGRGIMVEASPHVKQWRQDVAAVAFAAKPDSWNPYLAFHVEVEFVYARPKSHFGTGRNANLIKDTAPTHPTSRAQGDLDKTCRALLDACTDILFADDSQVVALTARKRYAKPNEPNCTFVQVSAIQTIGSHT